MSQYWYIHPENPQPRILKQAAEMIKQGGLIAYPTDSAYALGCHLGDKAALERIIRIRQLDDKHNFTLLCRDLSDIATYAKVDNSVYRLLKAHTPGAYTFILSATSEVPKRLLHPKRKTIGIRVPQNPIAQLLLQELNEPLLTTTLKLPEDEYPLTDPDEIKDRVGNRLDAILDGGFGSLELTSMIDLSGDEPVILREGLGDVSAFI
jgi:tRNA threonylcarbamoyl adenosine modification protein (Sua5/YciO/YrdC/YwlC family)